MENVPVREGFICPICKNDLGDATKLLNHFQEDHSEEQDFIKAFKDLYGKAKKKILKQDSQVAATNHVRQSSDASFDYTFDPQEIGITVSHTELFQSTRNERMQRLSVPMNQLIIRLERLLVNMPSDPVKRKAHEQNVVAWIEGDAVDRCPDCAGAFYLTRRKHHCRTCGGIMCNDCSHFMALNTARRILDRPAEEEPQGAAQEPHLRLCIHCIRLLERREERRELRSSKPIISQFYQRLSEYRQHAEQLRQQYLKMSLSFDAGESVYNLEEAQEVKVKILKLAESIDSLSSRIAVLGKETDHPPQGQALRLQNMVRTAAAAFLKTQLLNLPGLPTEEQFLEAQKRRREAITARIEKEKRIQSRLNNHQNNISRPSSSAPPKQSTDPTVSLGQGWVPEKMKVNEAEDPLMEQINIIRSYIKEAKAAHKYDEVASLEENLHELKKEFWKKQTQQEDYVRSGESSEAASLSSYEEVRQSDSSH